MKRTLQRVYDSVPTSDGAGVKLKRSIGTHALDHLDPFLLLDCFFTDNPEDYLAGFPDHPHRGFETVTYMIEGAFRHQDSSGAKGVLRSGGVQWMTAGRGIVHSEMPEQRDGALKGFQLWINLPASHKMIAPRYQNIEGEELAVIKSDDGTMSINLIAGTLFDQTGPVKDIITEPLYADVRLVKQGEVSLPIPQGHSAFIYVFEGSVSIGSQKVDIDQLAVLSDGETLEVKAGDTGGRFLLLAATPIKEPIARMGPFVMNTREEVIQAYHDYQSGTFL